tara:strand:- start:527 stop:856 length:330 start_codon:yes stop_codon:yes gene_type:complete
MKIQMVKSRYEITKKEISVIDREDSFNTTFKMWKSETEIINYETLDELTNKRTLKYFRDLGGIETLTLYRNEEIETFDSGRRRPKQLISISPCGRWKHIREFTYSYPKE